MIYDWDMQSAQGAFIISVTKLQLLVIAITTFLAAILRSSGAIAIMTIVLPLKLIVTNRGWHRCTCRQGKRRLEAVVGDRRRLGAENRRHV